MCCSARSCESAVPWLVRGYVATERSSNSAVTAHIGALRIVKKHRIVEYDAVYSSRNPPCFGVV
jgi:hypothetical protein